MDVRNAALKDIDPATLYRILALRTDVFVVEQVCAYAELDGRDVEDGAELVWIEQDGDMAATLRTLRDSQDVLRIGRVATAKSHRGKGLAALLIQQVLDRHPATAVVLDAQAHLENWYARFGFVRTGPDFDEDGIPHTPMRRAADA
jgi:ElaA protein